MRRLRLLLLSSALAAVPACALAQSVALPEISVNAGSGEAPPPAAASESTVTPDQIAATPAARPGEVLEQTPGLIVTQHSGEGKANQYFLRGFNLDHGTDLAITVDGMPVNMRTHGHGQGYADVNFLIPELVSSMLVRKGPYFADEGDFASAGAVHIDYFDRLERNIAQATIGSFGYKRALVAGSTPAANGQVLGALDVSGYDGPWDVGDGMRKFSGVLRYSQGTALDGFSVTGMGYDNHWRSTDQIPLRAVEDGTIGRFGTLDPTDGGLSSRYSLSGRWSASTANTVTKVDAFAVRSSLQLFNNFTYFLDDPVNGDQFSQTDKRTLTGINASHTIRGSLGPFATETLLGIQTRYDDIHVGLFHTVQREVLSTVRDDHVREGSVGLYAQETIRWTNWMRTITAARYDRFVGQVISDTAVNSGNASADLVSPKASIIFGPFLGNELFFNAGRGFHSNDLRGVTITVDPNDKTTPLQSVPLLVRSQGGEVGVRNRFVPGLDSSLSVFVLDYASELLFVGDAGTTEPSRPSRRTGIEWTNEYKPLSWLSFDVDVAFTHARFTNFDTVGDRIPGAPNAIASAGVTFGEQLGWFGALKLRYFGPRPLIEDNSVRSKATTLVNGRIGYKFTDGTRVSVDGFNLLNAKASQIDYYYTSRLPGEVAGGVNDIHFHPVEPLAVRLTVAKSF